MNADKFTKALLATDKIMALELISEVLDPNNPFAIIENLVVPSMEKIGTGWENGSVALSQVYMSGRIVEEIVDELLPSSDPKRKGQPKMAIAVLDDFHLLGKRIIYSILRASGYNLLDFGRVDVEELFDRVINESVKIILISTLMLPSALRVRKLKDKLDQVGSTVKIVVGGAPFRLDKDLAHEVGADATASNAKDTLTVIENLVEVM